ncbi:MAG: hypothetical protein Q8Q49_06605 [bacterium]|nr:hypothetical protein [bacterium]
MQVREHVSEAVGRIFARKPEAVPEEFVEIRKIALSASTIWFDRRGGKQERFHDAALTIRAKLTPSVMEDPRFYRDILPEVHMRSLQLLGVSEQEGRHAIREACRQENREIPKVFDTGEVRQILESYLSGLVNHDVVFESPHVGESRGEANRRYLGTWTRIPSDLLDTVSPLPGRVAPHPVNIFKGLSPVGHIDREALLPVSA